MASIADRLAADLGLEPHPEGGRYRQLYRSTSVVSATGRNVERVSLTSILFLLARGEASRWHRVLSDEAWHFHEGEPLELFVVDAAFESARRHVLGRASKGRSLSPSFRPAPGRRRGRSGNSPSSPATWARASSSPTSRSSRTFRTSRRGSWSGSPRSRP